MKIYTLSNNNGVEGYDLPFIAFKTLKEAEEYRLQICMAQSEWRHKAFGYSLITLSDLSNYIEIKETDLVDYTDDLVKEHMKGWYDLVNRVI